MLASLTVLCCLDQTPSLSPLNSRMYDILQDSDLVCFPRQLRRISYHAVLRSNQRSWLSFLEELRCSAISFVDVQKAPADKVKSNFGVFETAQRGL